MINFLKKASYFLISVFVILSGIYIDLSLYFRVENQILSIFYISLFSSLSLFFIYSLWIKKFYKFTAVFYLVSVVIWMFWYGSIRASNDRNWQKDVALLSYATINGNLITVHNIRNFKYKSEFDYRVSYYDKTFDIDRLKGIDFISTYWMGPDVAHTFLSFSFQNNQHLAISIEARKEIGESYSMIRGFFKDNELYYVVADERDLIGLRTNIRKNPPEHVYMYEINADIKDMKKVFLNYINKINELKKRPQFYDTLTRNCTTSIWNNSLVHKSNMSLTWEILLSGHTAFYLYKKGLLKTYGLSFEELQKRAYINPLVEHSKIDENYSSRIRKKLLK